MKTLSFINRVLEYNYDCEYKLSTLDKSKCFLIKSYHEDLKLLIRNVVKPGAKIEIQNIIERIFQNTHDLFLMICMAK